MSDQPCTRRQTSIGNKEKKLLEKNVLLKRALAIVNEMNPGTVITHLRPKQSECVLKCVETGKDLLCVLATGSGKSLVFQLLPVFHTLFHKYTTDTEADDSTVTIVVSPLNAIISQQQQTLGKHATTIGKSRVIILYSNYC